MTTKSHRSFWRIVAAATLVLVVGGAALWLGWRRHVPREILPDVRAGLAARGIQNPDERLHKYLELRYGSLDDAAIRQKVFLDFFDIERIKALQFIVRHSPENQRQESIHAMSRWVESYRNSLTPSERAVLREKFSTPEGRSMLRRATAQYNSQDVRYRGQTAGVISQLLKTIHSVEQP